MVTVKNTETKTKILKKKKMIALKVLISVFIFAKNKKFRLYEPYKKRNDKKKIIKTGLKNKCILRKETFLVGREEFKGC